MTVQHASKTGTVPSRPPLPHFSRSQRVVQTLSAALLSPLSKALILPLLLATILFLAMVQTQNEPVGPPLDGLSRTVYRAAFFVNLPVRILMLKLAPRALRFASWEELACSSLITSYGLTGLLCLARAHRRHRARKRQESGKAPRSTRRAFLIRSANGIALTGAAGVGGYTSLIAPQRLRVQRDEIPIRDLPPGLDGLRICHITDTHHGPFIAQSYLEEMVEQANALKPDLFVLTGDYVHDTPHAIPVGIGVFEGLRAPLGTLAVLGNHDHWEGAKRCREYFQRIGVPLIDNQRRFLTPDGFTDAPMPDQSLCIAGVGDLWAGRVLLKSTLEDVPEATPRIVLSHNPDVAERMSGTHRVDLMMSGHTHGGQVDFPVLGTLIVPSRYGSKYAGGLCQAPHCRVLVSRGVGMAVMPVRFCVPPEIGLVTLRRG